MIRLTFNAHSDPEIHLFNKSIILLGSDSNLADLILPGSSIQPIHLKIMEQNGFPILINYANDPFVSINGHPFGKKLLNSGDVIIVHHLPILFENLQVVSGAEKEDVKIEQREEKKAQAIVSLSDNKIKKEEVLAEIVRPSKMTSDFSSFSLPFEKDVEALKEEDLKKTSLDTYLKDIESIQDTAKQPSSIPITTREYRKARSLKDDYLRELEDDNHGVNGPFGNLSEPSHLYQAWKWILLFIFSLFAISGLIGSTIYFNVTDKKDAQETKAAQAVADIAMALTYAHLNHSKPLNQNWSDADFLKSNLQGILPDISSYASQIDPQGQLNCCPYSLRIYTSSDLSHFLLIAQPAPNLFYWLIPQSVIVMDSHLMELRTMSDVRSLNRLLNNPDLLEGQNGKEITAVVKQGNLIPLSSLASDSGHSDLIPPKNLAWVRPGAENFIHNAPRYYRLGLNLIQKAMTLSTSKGSSQEVAALKEDVKNFSCLNHAILYCDQGKKSALLARQGLMMFAPSDKLLFGYILLNAHGQIHQVHLLKSEDERKESSLATKDPDIALQTSNEMEIHEGGGKKSRENPVVDRNHPIYIQLQALVNSRENELKPILSSLVLLLNKETQLPGNEFQMDFQSLSHAYLVSNANHKQILKESIKSLYHQHEDIPIHHFLEYIKELHLEQLIQYEEGEALATTTENYGQNIEILLTQNKKSKSLTELDHLIDITNTWLQFDYIKDPKELMHYQNLLRNHLLEKLESFLLSPEHIIVKAEDREILQHILFQERLIKPEEREFFLEEFDILLAMQKP